ncbi:MAG: lipoate--protein ligase [Ruminococcaceae bacterium]|nr:lipoate--protein ligase [Oscillospiraceae bacterium]
MREYAPNLGFMKYLRLHSTDPYYNLAVEEYLLRHTRDDIFMLWQNERTVVIGKNQNAYAEVDLDYAKKENIRVSRRISGGGAVYHDMGNVNYTFITSSERATALDYAYFTRPIIEALATLGVKAELSGRNDLECEGKKFSGNAQYTGDGRILHHGTLLYDTDADVMSRVLRVDKEKLAHRAVKSHKGRVGNLAPLLRGITAEEFIKSIEAHVLKTTGAERIEIPATDVIEALRERNASREWILSEKRYLTDYTVKRRKKYPFGIVCIEMVLAGEKIEKVCICGDFFGTSPVGALEDALCGQTLDALPPIDPSPYIAGMTGEDLLSLLLET